MPLTDRSRVQSACELGVRETEQMHLIAFMGIGVSRRSLSGGAPGFPTRAASFCFSGQLSFVSPSSEHARPHREGLVHCKS